MPLYRLEFPAGTSPLLPLGAMSAVEARFWVEWGRKHQVEVDVIDLKSGDPVLTNACDLHPELLEMPFSPCDIAPENPHAKAQSRQGRTQREHFG